MTKQGRPKGKRSDPDFIYVGGYVRKDTYKEVKHLLIDSDLEFSELMQMLLDDWIDSQYTEDRRCIMRI